MRPVATLSNCLNCLQGGRVAEKDTPPEPCVAESGWRTAAGGKITFSQGVVLGRTVNDKVPTIWYGPASDIECHEYFPVPDTGFEGLD